MPKLIKLYIVNVAIGFGLSAVFVGLLLWFNVGNLMHLISTSDKGWVALLGLWVANGVIFAGVQFAIAVMGLKDDDDDEPRGGTRSHVHVPLAKPIPVRVHQRGQGGRRRS